MSGRGGSDIQVGRSRIGPRLFSLLFLLVLAASVAGCAAPPDRSAKTPALPQGFGALVPNVEFEAYAYFRQSTPLVVQGAAESLGIAGLPGLTLEARVESLALWAGLKGEEPVLGLRALFQDEQAIPAIIDAFLKKPEGVTIWYAQQGKVLDVVIGQGPDAAAFRQAAEKGDFVPLETARPAVWNTLRALPPSPPQPPLGAGFLVITDQVVDLLLRQAKQGGGSGAENIERLKPLIQRAGIRHGVVAVYGPPLPLLRSQADLEGLANQPFSALAVLDSSLPGFALSFVFPVVLGADAEKVQVGGQTAYAPKVQGAAVLLRNEGSTILIAGARQREAAQALLATVGKE